MHETFNFGKKERYLPGALKLHLILIGGIENMRKYYKIFRIDTPTVEVCADREWKTYDLEQKCLIPDVEVYETEEEAEKYLDDYFDNFPERAKDEEYVIVKCYKK